MIRTLKSIITFLVVLFIIVTTGALFIAASIVLPVIGSIIGFIVIAVIITSILREESKE